MVRCHLPNSLVMHFVCTILLQAVSVVMKSERNGVHCTMYQDEPELAEKPYLPPLLECMFM